jgi:catechol 2,3-dioxygenase-like lactoylglutathione lyase family enzyme
MSVTALEHVLVLSDDIEATRRFYCRVVGLRVGERPPLAFPGYWLYAGATPCVHVAERVAYLRHAASLGLPTTGGDRGPVSVDHIAFNAADVERLNEQLETTGVTAVHNTVPNGGPHQVFIEDPNGVRIEINVSSGP